MIEAYATYPVAHCPCKRSWGLSDDDTHAVLLAGPEKDIVRIPLSENNIHTCMCGMELRILRAGKPVPKHPREK